jgi:succinate-semialdehyde dehydrogenase/glutarate-semialdehyde dehydrogenase
MALVTAPVTDNGAMAELISHNPVTGAEVGRVPVHQAAAVLDAVGRARAAQPAWAALPLSRRLAYLRAIRRAMAEHAQELADLIAAEMGKHPVEGLLGDVLFALTHLDYAINQTPRLLRPQRVRQGFVWSTRYAEISLEPRGVIGLISPYNYPILLTANTLFLALAAGNTLVAKPSEHTPLSTLRLAEICYAAGLPRDVFVVVTGDGGTGAALIESGIDGLVFVGGTSTGKRIAAAAGARLLPVVMELGGNNAMIILDDADLPKAARAAVWGGFVTGGQVCGRVGRILVADAVAARFTTLLQAETERVRHNRPGADWDMGPLTVAAGLAHARLRVAEAEAEGARVIAGGLPAPNENGGPIHCPPTILTDVRPTMRVMQEELFAPILYVHPVSSVADAVRLANDSEYSLTASVWGRNRKRAWAVARRVRAGSVVINDHLAPAMAAEAAWGGMGGASGYGRLGGLHGLLGLTHPKYIVADRLVPRRYPWWFPYTPTSARFAHSIITLLYTGSLPARLRAAAHLVRDLPGLLFG